MASQTLKTSKRPSSDARFYLRSETASLHQEVDRAAEHFDLDTPHGLHGFLNMMGAGLARIEPGITNAGAARFFERWPTRTRLHLVQADLGNARDAHDVEPEHFADEGEAWGALYVLEGSRLGGRTMQSKLDCQFLTVSNNDRYWPTFVIELEKAYQRLNAPQAFATGARKAFEAFLP